MKLYVWYSEALKQYAQGHIIAVGSDIEEARANARSGFSVRAMERWKWLFEKYPDWKLDEDEQQEHDDLLKQFEEDIQKEPVGEPSLFFFVNGSE